MANIRNVDTYTDYFRQKAVADPALQHDPASEDGDAPIGSMHFSTWSVDDLVTGLNTQLGFPVLLLEMYETTTQEQGVMDVKGIRHGAFTILASSNTPKSNKARQAAYQEAETIILRIIQAMWEDHYGENAERCASQFETLSFENMEIMPVGSEKLLGKFGWRCEFSFTFSNLLQL